jgi:hypothetical protein
MQVSNCSKLTAIQYPVIYASGILKRPKFFFEEMYHFYEAASEMKLR